MSWQFMSWQFIADLRSFSRKSRRAFACRALL
jgi:hypothetical protein